MNEEQYEKLLKPFCEIYGDCTVRETLKKLKISMYQYNCLRAVAVSRGLIKLKKPGRPKRERRKKGKYYSPSYREGVVVGYIVKFKGKYICNCKTEQEAKKVVEYLKANEKNYSMEHVQNIQSSIRKQEAKA